MANSITVPRGTTYTIYGNYQVNGEAADITGAAIRFTIKTVEWDTDADDSDALLTKAGTITSAAGGTYEIDLTDVNTYVDAGTYFYDVKIELSDGTIYRLSKGSITIDGSPTNRTS